MAIHLQMGVNSRLRGLIIQNDFAQYLLKEDSCLRFKFVVKRHFVVGEMQRFAMEMATRRGAKI